MPDYIATNVSARSSLGETSERSIINIDGSRLHPERTYAFGEFTSDILEGMVEDKLRVETDAGAPVTIESLEASGYVLKTKTVTERTSGIDGRVDHSYEKYYLEEEGEPEEPAETDGEEPPEDSAEEADEDNPAEEEAAEENAAEENVVAALKEKGAIPEDAETSSDVNAAPMAKIIRSEVGDRIPDWFFEGETRKTVNDALGQ